MTGSSLTAQTVRYRERLWVPWWWWPVGTATSWVPATSVNMGVRDLPNWLPYTALAAVAVALLLWLSRTDVRVINT